jgi:hypothetical protein
MASGKLIEKFFDDIHDSGPTFFTRISAQKIIHFNLFFFIREIFGIRFEFSMILMIRDGIKA